MSNDSATLPIPQESTDTEGKLKEYELLRQAISSHDRSTLQLTSISIGFIGIISAQGLTSENPYVFLIGLPVLFVLSVYISDKRWTIWLIASYIKTYLESDELGPRWETRLHEFRSACKERRHFSPGQNIIRVEYLLSNILGMILCLLFVVYARGKNISWLHFLMPAIGYLCLLVQTTSQYVRLTREGREGGTLGELWPKEIAPIEGQEGHSRRGGVDVT